MDETKTRREALKRAEDAWDKAPAHIKVMAGAYVGPLLEALKAIDKESEDISRRLIALEMAEAERDKVGEGIGHE